MELNRQFDDELTWSPAEKKIARRAFDESFNRQCATIKAKTKRMLENGTAPSDLWRVQEYLYEERRTVDRIYDYRYSRLIMVFSILMRDGWLTEMDSVGLQQQKIDRIKTAARI